MNGMAADPTAKSVKPAVPFFPTATAPIARVANSVGNHPTQVLIRANRIELPKLPLGLAPARLRTGVPISRKHVFQYALKVMEGPMILAYLGSSKVDMAGWL